MLRRPGGKATYYGDIRPVPRVRQLFFAKYSVRRPDLSVHALSLGVLNAVHMAGYVVDEICSEFVQIYRALLIIAPKTSETRQ